MEIRCTTEDHLELGELTEFQGGLKSRTDTDYAKIITSIKKYGFCFPFFVWRHDGINHVLDGHGRLGALQRLQQQGEQIPALPVVYVDCADEEAAKNLLLRLNSQYGQMTVESVLEFMDGLDFDPVELALPEGIIDFNLEEQEKVEDDEAPEPELDEPAVSQQGEIYQLGPHRLMCGDSTSREDIETLMGGAKVDMVFTDPPYGYEYESNHQNKFKVLKNDDKILDFVNASYDVMRENCPVYSFCGWQTIKPWLEYFGNTELSLKNIIVWKKNNWSMGVLTGAYAGQYEIIVYLNKGRVELKGARDTDIWEFDREPPKVHPTMKPIELIAYALGKSSETGGNVLDCFGGSGSTLIACEQTGRKCYMMELDPHYCDVIRRRWTRWAKENGVEPGEGALE